MAVDTSTLGQGGLNAEVDIDALVEGIGLTTDEIAWRKEFINFSEDDADRLAALSSMFSGKAESIADQFYENITNYDDTMAIVDQSDRSIEQLKHTQEAYVKTLTGGTYDAPYFKNRARIGKIHDLLDMPMKYYIGQFNVYYESLIPLLFNRCRDDIVDAVESELEDESEADIADAVDTTLSDSVDELMAVLRIINLDMQVVVDSYIHSYNQKLTEMTDAQRALMRSIEDDLEQPTSTLYESAEDVADSTAEVRDVLTEQTTSLADAATDVDDLSASIEEIAMTADQVTQKSNESENLARAGQESADDALDAMEDLEQAVQTVSTDIERLNDQMNEVNAITDVIDDIAEKTDLLALNASIEAARAGEAGQGFAVVADEIKSLANQSKENAASIDTTISQVKEESDDTVESLNEARKRFEEGSAQVEQTMSYLDKIVASAQDTAVGIEEVSHAADDQAATTEEVSTIIEDLVGDLEQVRAEFNEIATANQEQKEDIMELFRTAERLSSGVS